MIVKEKISVLNKDSIDIYEVSYDYDKLNNYVKNIALRHRIEREFDFSNSDKDLSSIEPYDQLHILGIEIQEKIKVNIGSVYNYPDFVKAVIKKMDRKNNIEFLNMNKILDNLYNYSMDSNKDSNKPKGVKTRWINGFLNLCEFNYIETKKDNDVGNVIPKSYLKTKNN
ncbi:MAG: hypothetical protein ACI4OT_00855 [Bacilli bacterium]